MAITLPNIRGLFERSRTVPAGEWVTPVWDNAWLTTTQGSLSSIVCDTYRYTIIGKTVTLLFWINATVTNGVYYLNLRTPNGWSIVGSVLTAYSTKENGGVWHGGHVYAANAMTSVYLSQYTTSPNYTGACAWAGQITFPISN